MKKPQFLKQKMMTRVVWALAPVFLAGVYFFGWRVAAIVAVSMAAAFVTEWIMASYRNGKVTYACFVTAILFALSLPPTVPLWITAVGAVVAILFGKEVFGGFGRNIFNPAIVGRAFVYVSFPVEMTSGFVPVFGGFPGGFTRWSFMSSSVALEKARLAGIEVADAVSAATPMVARRDFSFITDTANLILGNIGQVFYSQQSGRVLAAGSIGEVSAFILVICGIYLLVTKTAQWRLMAATVTGAVVLNLLLRNAGGIEAVPPLQFTLFSGGFLYASVFMVTDPISAPKDRTSQWIYGLLIGMLIIFFRYRSVFSGGVAFAILFGNMLSPSLDLWIKRFRNRGGVGKQ